MKSKIFIALSVFGVLFISCKNDEKKEAAGAATQETAKTPVKQLFSVDMEVIAPQADDIAVYYNEDKTMNFSSDRSQWQSVTAQPGVVQKLTFNFPEQIIPTNIRFDFGTNKKQDDLILKNFKLSYYGKTFEAQGSDFFKYFSENDSIKTEIDPAKGTIKFLKNVRSVPYYYPRQPILDEISRITK